MNPQETPEKHGEDRLEELEKKVARLEGVLKTLLGEKEKAQAKKKEIERRRLLENLPLTALIVALAVLAAQWAWRLLGL